MGGVNVEGGGGKRSLDFDLNLVPLIDLLSCCISFLLITAVWTQMAKLETSQTVDGGGASEGEKPQRVAIVIHPAGYELTLPSAEGPCSIPKNGARFDDKALRNVLEGVKRGNTGKIAVGIAAADDIQFEAVVDAMDAAAELELREVTLGAVNQPAQDAPRCSGG